MRQSEMELLRELLKEMDEEDPRLCGTYWGSKLSRILAKTNVDQALECPTCKEKAVPVLMCDCDCVDW